MRRGPPIAANANRSNFVVGRLDDFLKAIRYKDIYNDVTFPLDSPEEAVSVRQRASFSSLSMLSQNQTDPSSC